MLCAARALPRTTPHRAHSECGHAIAAAKSFAVTGRQCIQTHTVYDNESPFTPKERVVSIRAVQAVRMAKETPELYAEPLELFFALASRTGAEPRKAHGGRGVCEEGERARAHTGEKREGEGEKEMDREIHTRTHARTHTRTHARTQARTHAHIHTQCRGGMEGEGGSGGRARSKEQASQPCSAWLLCACVWREP